MSGGVRLSAHAAARYRSRIGAATDEEIIAEVLEAMARGEWQGRTMHAAGARAVFVCVRHKPEGPIIVVTCLYKAARSLKRCGSVARRKAITEARRARKSREITHTARMGARNRQRQADVADAAAEWEELFR
ncbi:MAG: hypothetical protein AAGF32_03405 [Pseudomonadota bacterium]